MNCNEVGILGYGEVGRAIEKLYPSIVKIKDIKRDDCLYEVKYLHVCIPFTDSFVKDVIDYITEYSPEYAIIHSTVLPGTTTCIEAATQSKLVHSPIRGVHPNLYEGLITFVKYIGSNTDCKEVVAHFKELGVITKVVDTPETSELAKLLSTTYYGLCIAWHGEMKGMCDSLGVDFSEAVTDWNRSYNEGYTKLDMDHVVRPVLYPPDKIGGHCILPNADILSQVFSNKALDLVKKWG